jgi:hypothetical protein
LSTLFRIPAVALTNGDFDGEEVLGRRIKELYMRLGNVADFDAEFVSPIITWWRSDRPLSRSARSPAPPWP